MYKKYLVIILSFALITGLIIFVLNSIKSASNNTNTTTPIPTLSNTNNLSTPNLTEKSGNYIVFNNNLDEYKNTKRLLFFYANWCPTCSGADKDINSNTNLIPSDLSILRINYNDTDTDEVEKQLANKYGITYQHTFVLIDENSNEIKKWNGGNFKAILENIK